MHIESEEVLLKEAARALLEGKGNIALKLIERTLSAGPQHPEAVRLLALAQAAAQDFPAAIASLDRALAISPKDPRLYRDLAAVHFARGDHGQSALLFQKVLQLNPDDLDALDGYGSVLLALENAEEAAAVFQRMVILDPCGCAPRRGLARARILQKRYAEAAALCDQALQREANDIDARRLLGEVYGAWHKHEAARATWEFILLLAPGDPDAHAHLVLTCWALGDLEGTLAHAWELIETGRAKLALRSFYLYLLLYRPSETRHTIRRACESLGRSLNPAWRTRWWPHKSERTERLRIGYLSGEFTHGPAYHFLSSLIGNHAEEAVEVFCYHTRPQFDRESEWYQRASQWRDCRELGDAKIVEQVRSDAIDILVDLSGHFPDGKLEIYAQRAAPVQVAYPNCPITTGVGNIDYIFTDRWTCPWDHEDQYTEQPVYLPSGYLVYSPPETSPDVIPLPALRRGAITFGLFQRRPKMNTEVWDSIAEVLRRCSGSRLLIQNAEPTLDDPASRARQELIREFAARGVEKDRLCFAGGRPNLDVLRLMSEADIALDTFPYQGQTTTCECLWMGVPVITLSGARHAARVGTALLERVGLGYLAAGTAEQYVRNAVALAHDIPQVARLRVGMRERLRQSALLDGPQLAREVESAYRWMWEQWCGGAKGDRPGESVGARR